jgi:hypothetical protein
MYELRQKKGSSMLPRPTGWHSYSANQPQIERNALISVLPRVKGSIRDTRTKTLDKVKKYRLCSAA